MKHRWIAVAIIAMLSSRPAAAGLYADDLARCLVGSTPAADGAALVRWMFAALAQHPSVSSLRAIGPADLDKSKLEALGKSEPGK